MTDMSEWIEDSVELSDEEVAAMCPAARQEAGKTTAYRWDEESVRTSLEEADGVAERTRRYHADFLDLGYEGGKCREELFSEDGTGKKMLHVAKVRDLIVKEWHPIMDGETLMVDPCKTGCYVSAVSKYGGDHAWMRQCFHAYGLDAFFSKIDQVLDAVKVKCSTIVGDRSRMDRAYIIHDEAGRKIKPLVFLNGILDPTTCSFHRKGEGFLTNKLVPRNLIIGARDQRLDRFIDLIVSDSSGREIPGKRNALRHILAKMIAPEKNTIRESSLVVITGRKGGGKSTIAKLFCSLYGRGRAKPLEPQHIEGNGFDLSEIIGVEIGLMDDVDPKLFRTPSMAAHAKSLLAGAEKTANIKYQAGRTFQPCLALVVTANEPIGFGGADVALDERTTYFPFSAPVASDGDETHKIIVDVAKAVEVEDRHFMDAFVFYCAECYIEYYRKGFALPDYPEGDEVRQEAKACTSIPERYYLALERRGISIIGVTFDAFLDGYVFYLSRELVNERISTSKEVLKKLLMRHDLETKEKTRSRAYDGGSVNEKQRWVKKEVIVPRSPSRMKELARTVRWGEADDIFVSRLAAIKATGEDL